MRYTGSLMTNS